MEYPQDDPDDIKCKNFKICEGMADWMIEYCSQCYWMYHYKTLEVKNNTDCPVCLEENQECVKYLNCSHFVCIKCYKKQVYPEKLERTGEPVFPYGSDIEDEYYEDQENPKWKSEYPLIEQYNEEYEKWDDEWEEKECKISDQVFSKKCPVCREPILRTRS